MQLAESALDCIAASTVGAGRSDRNHSIPALARRLQLSPRHFARLFKKEVGVTPNDWVVDARVTVARTLLESGVASPKEIASECGFANVDTLRRAFVRLVGISPVEYRKRHAPEYA